MKDLTEKDELMIINQSGITIRMSMAEVKVQGRATQGVRLIRLADDDIIGSVAKIDSEMIVAESTEIENPPVDSDLNNDEDAVSPTPEIQ